MINDIMQCKQGLSPCLTILSNRDLIQIQVLIDAVARLDTFICQGDLWLGSTTLSSILVPALHRLTQGKEAFTCLQFVWIARKDVDELISPSSSQVLSYAHTLVAVP
jgi:hypothetical protein